MRYASIDIGTVTCRCLVADVDDAGLHELYKGYRICNLGEGVDATGVLKPEAMQRVANAIGEYLGEIEKLAPDAGGTIPIICLATSASRDAANADEFRQILSNLGVTLTVIPGAREAALSFKGASCGLEGQRVLVVDTGGGSTEVVAGYAGEDPQRAHSFDIGCRRATERFLHADPPTADEIAAARLWMRQEMAPYFEGLKADGLLPARIVAVAGTATSVVSVWERMEVYDGQRVQGALVTRNMLDSVYEQLVSRPVAERRNTVGLDPGRASVIPAGLMVLQTVLDLAEQDSYTASETDILQGIILDVLGR